MTTMTTKTTTKTTTTTASRGQVLPEAGMSFITVKEETEHRLHLLHEPSQRSWAIFAALVIIGMAAAVFSCDYIFWKLAFVTAAVLIGYSCVDEWEECVIDKKVGKIMFMRQSLLQKLFQVDMDDKLVIEEVSDITGAQVRSEVTRYSGLSYTVDINFKSRPSIGVTRALDIGIETEHQHVASLITKFLDLPNDPTSEVPPCKECASGEHADNEPSTPEKEPQPDTVAPSTDDEKARSDLSGNSTSDESFEEIDRKELQEDGNEAGDAGTQNDELCDSQKDKNV